MRNKTRKGWLIPVVVMIASIGGISQSQSRTLVVSGHPGNVPVTQSNGRSYVDLEALAQVVNGALSFNGNQITLTLSSAGGNTTTAPAQTTGANSGNNNQFSKAFLQAGIEEMSTIPRGSNRGFMSAACTPAAPRIGASGMGHRQVQIRSKLVRPSAPSWAPSISTGVSRALLVPAGYPGDQSDAICATLLRAASRLRSVKDGSCRSSCAVEIFCPSH